MDVLSDAARRGVREGRAGRPGLTVLAEALTILDNSGERRWEAELYRLKGEFLQVQQLPEARSGGGSDFLKALEIARKQQAKLLELRAVMGFSAAVAAPGQVGRSPRAAGPDLWLVHRGL